MTFFTKIIGFLLTLSWLVSPAIAQSLTSLQVSNKNSDAPAVTLSLENLDSLPQISFETTTIWTDGIQSFSGVPLKQLLASVGMVGAQIEMVALNDYAVTIALSDLEEDAPIVATRVNGKPMSVRDKGPFWVVFPYDADPKYSTEVHYSQSIWQLNRLNVSE